MKKALLGVLAATALLASGCGKPYITEEEGAPLSQYSNINVVVDTNAFLASKKGDEHYEGYVKSCEDLRNVVGGRVRNWIAQNFHGRAGAPAATLTVTVDEFFTGSGAARFFLGAVANGHLDCSAKISAPGSRAHTFRLHAEIAGVGMDKLSAYVATARGATVYIQDHL